MRERRSEAYNPTMIARHRHDALACYRCFIVLAASHRVPAVQAFVARAASHRDAPADIAGGGVGLHVAALLAEGISGDGEAEVGFGSRVSGLGFRGR